MRIFQNIIDDKSFVTLFYNMTFEFHVCERFHVNSFSCINFFPRFHYYFFNIQESVLPIEHLQVRLFGKNDVHILLFIYVGSTGCQ